MSQKEVVNTFLNVSFWPEHMEWLRAQSMKESAAQHRYVSMNEIIRRLVRKAMEVKS
jgi:hypothetical protein